MEPLISKFFDRRVIRTQLRARWSLDSWQTNSYLRALPQFAFDLGFSTHVLDDVPNDRQPETISLVAWFGGEEGTKYLRQSFFVHAATRVGQHKFHARSGLASFFPGAR